MTEQFSVARQEEVGSDHAANTTAAELNDVQPLISYNNGDFVVLTSHIELIVFFLKALTNACMCVFASVCVYIFFFLFRTLQVSGVF